MALCRAFFAAVALVAIAVQLTDLAGKGVLNPVSYFSYFTIDSNLIAAAILLVGAANPGRGGPRLDLFRGGAVVYMSITGIVFTLLLSNTDVDTAIPWVNTVVHELMPLVILADWLVTPPATRLPLRQGSGVAELPARLDHLHADPRQHRQPLSISLPESRQRRLRERRGVRARYPRRDAGRLRAHGRARERLGRRAAANRARVASASAPTTW